MLLKIFFLYPDKGAHPTHITPSSIRIKIVDIIIGAVVLGNRIAINFFNFQLF